MPTFDLGFKIDTSRSIETYWRYLEATTKFDYLVASICVALVAYLGARFHIERFGLNGPTVELVSLLAFLGSTIAALKRIETTVTLLGVMHERLHAEESAGMMASAAASGGAVVDFGTGERISQLGALKKARVHRRAADSAERSIDSLADATLAWYRRRDVLLVGGFLILILSRIMPALGA